MLIQLICAIYLIVLPGQFVFDDAALLSSEEASMLNERLQLLETDRGIKIGVVTTISLEGEKQKDALLTLYQKAFLPEDTIQKEALWIVIAADEGVCHFYNPINGQRVDIPKEARFAIEKYGFSMISGM